MLLHCLDKCLFIHYCLDKGLMVLYCPYKCLVLFYCLHKCLMLLYCLYKCLMLFYCLDKCLTLFYCLDNNSTFKAHSNPLFSELKVLNLHDTYKLCVLTFMHGYFNDNLPSSFQNMFKS